MMGTDTNYSLSYLGSSFTTVDRWTEGAVETKHGIVHVIQWGSLQWGSRAHSHAGGQMKFIHKNRKYTRRYSGERSRRGLVTLARRFAKEIAKGGA